MLVSIAKQSRDKHRHISIQGRGTILSLSCQCSITRLPHHSRRSEDITHSQSRAESNIARQSDARGKEEGGARHQFEEQNQGIANTQEETKRRDTAGRSVAGTAAATITTQ
jgi:hypothetical protein